jgi:aminopeptidase-like protein
VSGTAAVQIGNAEIGRQMYELVSELYPICRSITGDGVRETLRRVARYLPLQLEEVASGTPVFDWTVPAEWNIRDAYVKNTAGDRVVDFQKSNLHVVGYSVPVHQRMSLAELKEHLVSLPEHPDWIPYRTSYYDPRWGFCVSHRQLLDLPAGQYDVCIDASLAPGHLTYGEYYLPGATRDEVLFSCHVCHPSLANDNLSGIAVAAFLARHVMCAPRRYSYRFLFIPGTIGSIAWLSRKEQHVEAIKHGLVLAGLGDGGPPTYKKSRRGNAEIDRVVTRVFQEDDGRGRLVEFSPYGYDERQFCSPGFDLPVGCLMRTPHGEYPEYHTSADDLSLVRAESLADSLARCIRVVDMLEGNRVYVSQNDKCEPQLGKRGLYRTMGGEAGAGVDEMALLWVLNLADGQHSLLDMADRSGCRFRALEQAARVLVDKGLLRERDR